MHAVLHARQLGLLLVVVGADAAPPLAPPTVAAPRVVDATAAHQRTLNRPLLLPRWHQLVLVGFADAMLFHIELFCLIGTKAATPGTSEASSGHPAFIPKAKARGPQPEFSLGAVGDADDVLAPDASRAL